MSIQRSKSSLVFRCLGVLTLLALAAEASAHARWKEDGPLNWRSPRTDIKDGGRGAPCGETQRIPNDIVDKQPVVLKAGSEFEVEWEVPIYHYGYFQIRFSEANDQGFENNILLDDIKEDAANQGKTGYYKAKIILPDEECDTCTLQLVQVMFRANGDPNGNYYSCADVILTKSGTLDPDPADTTPPEAIGNLLINSEEEQATLSWANPVEDYFRTLVLQSDSEISAQPMQGSEYQTGDSIGAAQVVSIAANNMLTRTNLTGGSTVHFAVFAFDESLNYSSVKKTQALIPEKVVNEAPVVSLLVEQDMAMATTIYQDKGTVVVQASVTDANTNDSHSFSWANTDADLVDTDANESSFSFDPSGLTTGDYVLKVDVTDNGEPALTTSQTRTITVAEPQVENIAPQVKVTAQQYGRNRLTAYQNDGNMILYADVTDDNSGDVHTFEWTPSDASLVDIDSREEYFTFQAADVPVGTYTVSLKITDDGSPAKSVEEVLEITVEEKKVGGSIGFIWLSVLAGLMFLRRRF